MENGGEGGAPLPPPTAEPLLTLRSLRLLEWRRRAEGAVVGAVAGLAVGIALGALY